MKAKVSYIPLKKIKLKVTLKTYNTYLNRMKRIEKYLLAYDTLLPVEKDPNSNNYILVGAYDKYAYLQFIEAENAPCIIEEESKNEIDQYTKILRRLFNKGDSTKENRTTILKLLSKLPMPIKYITEKTSLTSSEIKNNYKYNINIPQKYINEYTTVNTMNWIEQLSVNQNVKEFLYKRASLPEKNSERLTNENIKIIKRFLKQEPKFYFLAIIYQIKILKRAIDIKNMLIDTLKSLVDDYYQSYKVI